MSTEDKLKKTRYGLHEHWICLQVVGQALTSEEERRAKVLGHEVEGDEEPLGVNHLNGSYTVTNDQISAELRSEIEEFGMSNKSCDFIKYHTSKFKTRGIHGKVAGSPFGWAERGAKLFVPETLADAYYYPS